MMKTIKIVLFAIFVLILSDKVASVSFAYGLSYTNYLVTKALGVIVSTGLALWAIAQD